MAAEIGTRSNPIEAPVSPLRWLARRLRLEKDRRLHAVEELFVHDFAVGNFVQSDFFHLETSRFRLESDVHFKGDGEVSAGDERAFDRAGVDFVVFDPPFAFGSHGVDTFALGRLSGRRAGFDADDSRVNRVLPRLAQTCLASRGGRV